MASRRPTLDKALVALAPLGLRGLLARSGSGGVTVQPEAHEQRQGLDGDREVALEPLDLPGEPIEPAGEGGLAALGGIGRQEGRDGGLDEQRPMDALASGESVELVARSGSKIDS